MQQKNYVKKLDLYILPVSSMSIDYANLPNGISYQVRGKCLQFITSLTDLNGKRTIIPFSLKRYGEEGAFQRAKDLCDKITKERDAAYFNRIYKDQNDGTTIMNLAYKDVEIKYTVDNVDVPFLQQKRWVCNNEGYSVISHPKFTYMHRFLMNP